MLFEVLAAVLVMNHNLQEVLAGELIVDVVERRRQTIYTREKEPDWDHLACQGAAIENFVLSDHSALSH